MARTQRVIDAPPTAVFDVLADPRSYAYWVIGSKEIRSFDPNWPEVGSSFDHTVGMGPLCVKDHTYVEAVEPGRFIQLHAQARPVGTARVKLELEPEDGRTRVTMIEDPADTRSAFLFQPLTHLATHLRNVRSLRRLAELAEGRKPIPTSRHEGTVENPKRHGRRAAGIALGRGAAAGAVGAAAMSVSTNVEMRVRGRPPSYAPAESVARLLGLKVYTDRQRKLIGAAGHAGTAVTIGAVRGLLDRAGLGPRSGGLAVFAIAMTPELVIVPALRAADPPWRWSRQDVLVSVMHHAVYAATTTVAYEQLRERG